MAAAADDEAHIEDEIQLIKNRCEENEDVIAREVKSGINELFSSKMATIFGDALDDVLRKKFDNEQNGVLSVV